MKSADERKSKLRSKRSRLRRLREDETAWVTAIPLLLDFAIEGQLEGHALGGDAKELLLLRVEAPSVVAATMQQGEGKRRGG